MATNWQRSEKLADVARLLIELNHQNLKSLGVRVDYWQRDDKPMRGDQPVIGGVVKVQGLNAARAGSDVPYFDLWVPDWLLELETPKFFGLVDWLLCHCEAGRDDEGEVKITKRIADFTGFNRNIRNMGFWNEGLEAAFKAMKDAGQMRLDFDALGFERRPVIEVNGTGSLDEADLAPGVRGAPLDLSDPYDSEDPEEAATLDLGEVLNSDPELDEEWQPEGTEAPSLQVLNGEANGHALESPSSPRGLGARTLRDWQGGMADQAEDVAATGGG